MKNSYKYFENRDCEYYPCHEGQEELNCLFCYCPMYRFEDCLGSPRFIERGEKKIKDCSACSFPHVAEHYEQIMHFLREHK